MLDKDGLIDACFGECAQVIAQLVWGTDPAGTTAELFQTKLVAYSLVTLQMSVRPGLCFPKA